MEHLCSGLQDMSIYGGLWWVLQARDTLGFSQQALVMHLAFLDGVLRKENVQGSKAAVAQPSNSD